MMRHLGQSHLGIYPLRTVLPSLEDLHRRHHSNYCNWAACQRQSRIPEQSAVRTRLTLLEFSFRGTMPELRTAEDADTSATAMRLLGAVDDEMDWPYGDVVQSYLLQPFDLRDFSFEAERMQQKVFEDIVAPLIKDFKTICPSKAWLLEW